MPKKEVVIPVIIGVGSAIATALVISGVKCSVDAISTHIAMKSFGNDLSNMFGIHNSDDDSEDSDGSDDDSED